MLQESPAAAALAPPSTSIWAAFTSWFTPAVLFLLLNLVIATIALSPSLLRRLKSFNFQHACGFLRSTDDEEEGHATQFQDHVHYYNLLLGLSEDKDPAFVGGGGTVEKVDEEVREVTVNGGHFSRTKSDMEQASGEVPVRLPAKMRKSASMKSAFGHFKEEDVVAAAAVEEKERQRPATVREKGQEGDEGVDAKADDFINRFKEQLKLQRVDSIVRYRDLIGRSAGNRGVQ